MGRRPIVAQQLTVDRLRRDLRTARGFDATEVLAAKVGRLDRWFRDQGLDTAVVGMSGGVDSAMVLGLLCRAAALPDPALRQVVAVSIPLPLARWHGWRVGGVRPARRRRPGPVRPAASAARGPRRRWDRGRPGS